MPIVNKLPKRFNKWLQDGVKMGVLTEEQKNNFISRYISLRMTGVPVLHKRKPKTIIEDEADKAIDAFINANPHTFECDENAVKQILKLSGSIKITSSMLYHRLQKRVESGTLKKVNVQGSKKVIYGKTELPINK